jgi:hypothetical protein
MKKYLIIAIAIAAFCISGVAYALDVSVDGEVAVRGRYSGNGPSDTNASYLYPGTGTPYQYNGLANSHSNADNEHITFTRFVLDININGDGVRGKLALMNDWNLWGGGGDRGAMDKYEGYCGNGNTGNNTMAGNGPQPAAGAVAAGCGSTAFIREAWIDFIVPGTPIGVKAGRMLGQLGNGWFLMSEYGGQDAWVLYGDLGKVAQVGFQDVKLSSGTVYTYSSSSGGFSLVQNKAAGDVDLYTLFAVLKPSDTATLSFDLSYIHDNAGIVLTAAPINGEGQLWNIGMSWNVKAGPVFIKGEVDGQQGNVQTFGKSYGNIDYSGYQGVIQAYIPIGIVTVDLGAAYGSGNRPGSSNHGEIVTLLDINQHYTYLYEYRTKSAGAEAGNSGADQGLTNTMFLEGGVMVQVSKSVAVGFDTFWLGATELASINGNPQASHNIGVETDAKINWQIYPNLYLNTQICWLATGSAYRTAGLTANSAANPAQNVPGSGGYMDDIYGIQSVLKLTF